MTIFKVLKLPFRVIKWRVVQIDSWKNQVPYFFPKCEMFDFVINGKGVPTFDFKLNTLNLIAFLNFCHMP